MSGGVSDTLTRSSVERRLCRLGQIVFGDRTGLALFAGALVFYGLYWRLGFFLNDTTLFANALANVADGRLALVETPYSLTAQSQPGAVVVDGQLYARNYGQILLSVPMLWLLEAVVWLTELRVAIAAGWSLLLVFFAWQLGHVLDRDWLGGLGAIGALVLFLATVSVGTAMPRVGSQAQLELFALQLSTMLTAAFLAVVLYRLVELFHGHPTGVVTGAALVLATPVGFWASIPKRHVLTAAIVVVTLYCFAVSRNAGRTELAARGLGYCSLAFLTLVHPFEAVFLFLVFAPLDVLTAPSRSVRSLVLLGGVFLLSLVPLFVVNTLISGNPLQPPRLLGGVPDQFSIADAPDAGKAETPADGGTSDGTGDGGTSGGTGDGGTSGGTGDGGTSGGTGDGGTDDSPTADSGPSTADNGGRDVSDSDIVAALRSIVPVPVLRAMAFSSEVVGFITSSLTEGVAAVRDVEQLYYTFVRRGWSPDVFRHDLTSFEAIDLSLLEASPLLAALCWLPVAIVRRFRAAAPSHLLPGTPTGQTDLLAAGYVFLFTLVYLPEFPMHSQITVRYLLPIVPLLLYGVVRLAVVRHAIETAPQTLVGSYFGAVTLGGIGLSSVLAVADPAVGEAMQLHALIGLGTAVVGAASLLTSPFHDDEQVVAVGLAVPAAATTLFVLFSGTLYFQYGPFALDFVGRIVKLLSYLSVLT